MGFGAVGFLALTEDGRVFRRGGGIPAIYDGDEPGGNAFLSQLVAGIPQGSIVDIGASEDGAFALDTLGQLWAWSKSTGISSTIGWNDPFLSAPQPTPFVTLTGVAAVYPGPDFVIAQKTDLSWWSIGGDFAGGISPYNLDGTIYNGDLNSFATLIAPFWNEATDLEGLNTVKVVTGSAGASVSLLIQGDGSVWAVSGANTSGSGIVHPITGIDYSQFFTFDPITGLTVDPAITHAMPIPWASNIVDAAICVNFNNEFALYLTADGRVYCVGGDAVYVAAAPPQIKMPTGVSVAALYPGAGAVIGSDGRFYTLGATPDGSLTFADALNNFGFINDAGQIVLDAGLSVYEANDHAFGTHFVGVNGLNLGEEFGFSDPTAPWAGFPPPPLSLNRLVNPMVGGFAQFGYRVYAIVQFVGDVPLVPITATYVPLSAVFQRGLSIFTWSRVIGPV